MSAFKRPESSVYYVDVRWRGYTRIRVSTDTTNKHRANDMERTLRSLRHSGRRDVLELIASGRLRLVDVHDSSARPPDALEPLRARAASPPLGDLVKRWLAWLRSPAG